MELGKYWYSCIVYRLYCFGILLSCLNCLHMFACFLASMAYIAQYKLCIWYATVGIVWEQLWILSLTVPKVEWFALYHTNLSHEVPLSFVRLKFTSFGWDMDMRRIRSDKTLRLGMTKAPQVNIQGRSKQLSLGMPRKASPLSSPTLSVTSLGATFSFITWSVFC